MAEESELAEWVAFANSMADTSRSILAAAMRSDADVTIKPDASMVTETDREIEARLRDMIEARYPRHGIVGEEHGTHNPGASVVWVLDPIDGTAPFVAGIPVFGTLIGLVRDGVPVLGVIDHPATDERWSGIATAGTTFNGHGVRTRDCAELASAIMTNSNPDFLSADERARFDRLRSRVRYTQYGGSCYAYGVLASGRTDIGIDAGLDAFDIVAPAAVIQGAGGTITDWNGEPITLEWSGRVVAAGDAARHREVLDILE